MITAVATWGCWKCHQTKTTLYKIYKDIYACRDHKDLDEIATPTSRIENKKSVDKITIKWYYGIIINS